MANKHVIAFVLAVVLPLLPVCAFAWCNNCSATGCCPCPGQAQCMGTHATCEEACGMKSSSGPGAGSGGGVTSQQQMQLGIANQVGSSIGQALGEMLFGDPQQDAAHNAAAAQELARQQQARQLDNSGIYLLRQKNYPGAINEFQKALEITPNDQSIRNNLSLARQKIKDNNIAGKNSTALDRLLGKAPAGAGNSSAANPNAPALNLVDLDTDPNTVDLRGTSKTSIDPASLKSQLEGVFQSSAPLSAPSNVVRPQVKDIELLFQAPQSTAHTVPAQPPQVSTDAAMKILFERPNGLDQIMRKQIQEQTTKGQTEPSAPVLPHN